VGRNSPNFEVWRARLQREIEGGSRFIAADHPESHIVYALSILYILYLILVYFIYRNGRQGFTHDSLFQLIGCGFQCVCVCLLSPGWNKPWHIITDPRKHKDPRCQRNLKASIYATGSLRQLCVGVWPMVSPTHAILTIYAEHTLDIARQLDFLLGSFLVCLRVIWGHALIFTRKDRIVVLFALRFCHLFVIRNDSHLPDHGRCVREPNGRIDAERLKPWKIRKDSIQ